MLDETPPLRAKINMEDIYRNSYKNEFLTFRHIAAPMFVLLAASLSAQQPPFFPVKGGFGVQFGDWKQELPVQLEIVTRCRFVPF